MGLQQRSSSRRSGPTATIAPPDREAIDRHEHELLERICDAVRASTDDVSAAITAEVERVAPLAASTLRRRLVDRATARLNGLGLLDDLLRDPSVDEVMVNAGTELWVERAGHMTRSAPLAPGMVDALLERVLAPLGRRIDRTAPVVDARLPDGARICAVVAPVAVDGTCLTVRRHRSEVYSILDYTTPPVASLIEELLNSRANVLIAGATSSGKTSLLAAMLDGVAASERLIIIEDTAELPVTIINGARLEARPANADATTAVSIDDLVVAAMRLRPDRLVIGEFRGTEVRAVVQALNTGHDGSLCTCHANSAEDGLRRVETLLLQAAPSWPLAAIRRQVSRSLDAVIFIERRRDGSRRIASIAEVVETDREPQVRPLADHDTVVANFGRGRR